MHTSVKVDRAVGVAPDLRDARFLAFQPACLGLLGRQRGVRARAQRIVVPGERQQENLQSHTGPSGVARQSFAFTARTISPSPGKW